MWAQVLSAWSIQSSLSTFYLIVINDHWLDSLFHQVFPSGGFLILLFFLSLSVVILLLRTPDHFFGFFEIQFKQGRQNKRLVISLYLFLTHFNALQSVFFDVHIVPSLASESPFKLTFMCFDLTLVGFDTSLLLRVSVHSYFPTQ